MQRTPLTSAQKNEVLRRQAFKCGQCGTDLEPIGRARRQFGDTGWKATKGFDRTRNAMALCPECHAKSGPAPADTSDAKKRRQRESQPTQKGKRFVKSGFDNKKF